MINLIKPYIPNHALRIFLMTSIPLFVIVSLYLLGVRMPKIANSLPFANAETISIKTQSIIPATP